MSDATLKAQVHVLLNKYGIKAKGDNRKAVTLKAGKVKYGQSNHEKFIEELVALFGATTAQLARARYDQGYDNGKADGREEGHKLGLADRREQEKTPLERALMDVMNALRQEVQDTYGY